MVVEGESEIVAGPMVEYLVWVFVCLFLGEYAKLNTFVFYGIIFF